MSGHTGEFTRLQERRKGKGGMEVTYKDHECEPDVSVNVIKVPRERIPKLKFYTLASYHSSIGNITTVSDGAKFFLKIISHAPTFSPETPKYVTRREKKREQEIQHKREQ